jgi:hypothetical protein
MTPLIQHRVITSPTDSLVPSGQLYDILYAHNGCFISAERPGIHALIPKAEYQVPGLATLTPFVNTGFPRVPTRLTDKIVEVFAHEAKQEVLLYLLYRDEWELFRPPQEQSRFNVKPLSPADRAGAIIEVHSHHQMPPIFSPEDDEAEMAFRFYAVIGAFPNPHINTRIGIYGHFHHIQSDTIFDLPSNLRKR